MELTIIAFKLLLILFIVSAVAFTLTWFRVKAINKIKNERYAVIDELYYVKQTITYPHALNQRTVVSEEANNSLRKNIFACTTAGSLLGAVLGALILPL